MNIKYIWDNELKNIFKRVINENELLLFSDNETGYGNIISKKYYRYNIYTKEECEILPDEKKLDIWTIIDITGRRNIIYYNIFHGNKKKGKISLICYDLKNNKKELIYESKEEEKLYSYRDTYVYIIDPDYILYQKTLYEECEENFIVFLYDLKHKKKIEIKNKLLNENIITNIFISANGTLVFKLGEILFDIFLMPTKGNAQDEYILSIDKEFFIRSILNDDELIFNIIAREKWDYAIPFVDCKDDCILFRKSSNPKIKKEDENIIYNLTNDKYTCFNQKDINSVTITTIKTEPHIVFKNDNSTIVKNINNNEIVLSIKNAEIKYIFNDVIVTLENKNEKDGTNKKNSCIYTYPKMILQNKKEGFMYDCTKINNELICLLL